MTSPYMKKKSNQQPLKEAIEQYLKAFRLDGRLKEIDLISSWEKLMGPTIAKYTGEITIRNRVMYVQIRSAPLRQELSMARTRVIENINDGQGQPIIDDIVFR